LLGEFKVGEDLVYVVLRAHRTDVFPTLRKLLNAKGEVPVFKKEHVVSKQGEPLSTGFQREKAFILKAGA
jgi:molybdopterin synthase catalytic subunit